MNRVQTTIDLREGVTVSILVTPALYGVAKRRGIDLVADANAGDTYASYVKIIYCAAINAWEVAAVDDPKRGEFPYTFADFHTWAWADRDRLTKMVAFCYEAMTGKRWDDLLKDAGEKAVGSKKNGSRKG